MNTDKLDFERLCADFAIKVARPGDRHYRGGEWVSLKCPFCTGQEGNHLAFNKKSNVFSCFRCGRHGKFQTLATLLGCTTRDLKGRIESYISDARFDRVVDTKADKLRERADEDKEASFELPGIPKLLKMHRNYLEGREYDAEQVYRDWELRSCDKQGRYAYRIVIPVTYRGKVVSFTTRDITGEAQDRYLACSPDDAIRHHKYCVYGIDKSPYKKSCVIVEGTFGVWRVGFGSGCTLGTGWTVEQAKIIAKRFSKSYIFFDPDELEATWRAEALSSMLSSYNGHTSYFVKGTGAKGRDTGQLTEEEIKEVRKLLK